MKKQPNPPLLLPKPIMLIVALVLLYGCAPPAKDFAENEESPPVRSFYQVGLSDTRDDLFEVILTVDSLKAENSIFRFASLGSYQMMDFGHFIRRLEAFDAQNQRIPVARIAANQWRVRSPQKLRKLRYLIAETWDTPVPDTPVMEMLGTSIEKDGAFLSGQAIFGFFTGLENAPMIIQPRFPEHWAVASAMPAESDGSLYARNFGDLATSPILAGELSSESDVVQGIDVRIHAYSRSGEILASDMLPLVREVITATDAFFGEVPLETYTMLFVFDETNAGGVEYHDNSVFVFKDGDLAGQTPFFRDVIAHEFFHLIIPFSITSDAIDTERFFQVKPTGHLWFIEGVTEWASDMIQVRGHLKSEQDFFVHDFREKLFREDINRSKLSLHQMSLSRGRARDDYLSVYSRGALVATLLDIYLLDVTFGKRGLREVLTDLYKDFGPERPLPEERFFEIFADYSGPELQEFIDRYIVGNEPLPVASVLERIGVKYQESKPAPDDRSEAGMIMTPMPDGIEVLWVHPDLANSGIQRKDKLVAFQNRAWTGQNFRNIVGQIESFPVGTDYGVTVLRNGIRKDFQLTTLPAEIRHVLTRLPAMTPRQERTWMAWRTNMRRN